VRRWIGHPAGNRILGLLDEHGPLGVTALAEADYSSQPTVSGAVSQLTEQGLVSKEHDPLDARRSVVQLTDQGRQYLVDARGEAGALVAERLARAGYTSEDVERAIAVLRAVMTD
jgi:DNA-binding MarR family transcriptional regulator